jgi:uncharacterized protein (TIGR02271 family)
MTTSDNPIVVGVFEDLAQAQQAMDELQRVGVSNEQIRYSLRGATSTGILNDLIALGLPQDEASYYEKEFESGHTIVMVKAPERQREARVILHRYGAYNASGRYDREGDFGSAADTITTDAEGNRVMQLREEQLIAQKEQVQAGRVRIGKQVVSEQQTLEVPVTREEIHIERHSVDRRPSDTPLGGDEVYRIPILAEQVLVEKHLVESEELVVGKRAMQETQQVTDVVRREEAHLERVGDVTVHGDVDDIVDQTEQGSITPE